MWYGMAVGLSFALAAQHAGEALDVPFGELLDYIAIEQIKREGFAPKHALTDEEIIPNVR